MGYTGGVNATGDKGLGYPPGVGGLWPNIGDKLAKFANSESGRLNGEQGELVMLAPCVGENGLNTPKLGKLFADMEGML